jgi:hypothetical protein
LLAHYDSGEPVVPQGVPLELASGQPATSTPELRDTTNGFLRDLRANQNALDRQGYGMVVKAGESGRYRGLLGELLEHREYAAGPLSVFDVEPRTVVTAADARMWVSQKYLSLSEEQQPGYLLIVGDLDEVPLVLQQALSAEAYAGRLAFTDPSGTRDDRAYGEYARKIVRWERHPFDRPSGRALFYAVDDGTAAVTAGNGALVTPGYHAFLEEHENQDGGRFAGVQLLGSSGWFGREEFLSDPILKEPAVLLTLSHGSGPPRRGWPAGSNLARSLQGAMSFGPGERLTAADLQQQSFIPGGVWFFVACFSAGTPAESDYASWLRHVRRRSVEVDDLMVGLSARPFIAALPQAALANPNGPQAVIGHVDLAWMYALRESADEEVLRYRHRRITDVLRLLGTEPPHRSGAWGSDVGGPGRVGPAFGELARNVGRFDRALSDHRQAAAKSGDYAAVDGELWMGRQDLNGYVLLGDPAVHLPLKRPERREEDFSAILGFTPKSDQQADTTAAAALEVSLWEALPHIDAYRQGGREALRRAGFDNPEAVEAEIVAELRSAGTGAALGPLDRAKSVYREGARAALLNRPPDQSLV